MELLFQYETTYSKIGKYNKELKINYVRWIHQNLFGDYMHSSFNTMSMYLCVFRACLVAETTAYLPLVPVVSDWSHVNANFEIKQALPS